MCVATVSHGSVCTLMQCCHNVIWFAGHSVNVGWILRMDCLLLITKTEVREPLANSDHNISFEIFFKTSKVMTKAKVYNFRKANYEGMKRRLTEVDWSKIEKTSKEKGWLFFKNVVLEAQNNYIPKVDKSKSKTKWPKGFNRSIKKNIQWKKALYRAFKRDQKKSTQKEYLELQTQVKKGS